MQKGGNMKSRNNIFVVFLVMMLVCSLFVSCSKSESTTTSGDAASTSAATSVENTEATADTATSGSEVPPPRGGKTLTVAFSENVVNIDPLDQSNMIGSLQNNMYIEPLVFYSSVGGYVPCLATSWESNEDGTEWTFHLREGVYFHNGEEFDSADCAVTFQRILDNLTTLNNPLQYWPSLIGYEVIDKYTFKIILSEPQSAILASLYLTPILPNEAFEEYGTKLWTDQHLVGTGPWKFVQWIDGQYIEFEKNENYWDKENYDPYYDRIIFRYTKEPASTVASHIAGDIQLNISSGGINPDILPLYKGTEDIINMISFDSGQEMYVGFSCKEGSPFADKKVREAFDYAIDRQSIIDNIIGSGKVPNGVITDTVDGYNPDLQGYTYDPEKAKQLLAESSYNGEEITLMCNTSLLKGEAIMLAMSEMLNAVGFNTNVQVVEVAVLNNVRKTGDYDVFAVAWMFAASDPGQFLTLRVMNDGHHTFYQNEELNDLIAQSNKEMDPEKRAELVRQCAQIMDEEHAPYSAFAQLRITYAADKGIVGLEGLYDDWFTLKYVDYDPTAK